VCHFFIRPSFLGARVRLDWRQEEWALNQYFPLDLAAGVGDYFYQHVTNDHGSGDQLGAFRGRVAGVGPLLGYALKAGAQEVDFSARWFH
jgi:hypothetical protein